MNVGEQLRTARVRQDLKIEELAACSGVHIDTIKGIEEGLLDVNLSTLYKLSQALRCSFAIGDMSI